MHSARNAASWNGTAATASLAGEFVSTVQVDSLGRTRRIVGNNGQQVTLTYDNDGNLKSRTDAGGRVTTFDYDPQNRLTRTVAPDGGITSQSYDTEGNLWTVTDPRGLVTRYAYNGFGQLMSAQSPDSGATTYGYDTAGRLASQSLANGKMITFTWDAIGRLKSRTAAGVTETFTYDEGTYGRGRLTRINDASGQSTWQYGAAGELLSQANTILGVTYTTAWSYDAVGRRTGMTTPTGITVGYAYDSYGRVTAVTSTLGAPWSTLANNLLYQPANDRLYAWRFGSNVARLKALDADGRITRAWSPAVHDVVLGYNSYKRVYKSTAGGATSFVYGRTANCWRS